MKVPLEGVQAAAEKVVEMHRRLVNFVREGMALAEIDNFVISNLLDMKCKSAFHLYQRGRLKFPSHACYSVNHCIVHGTVYQPFEQQFLNKGDILKIDVGILYQGWIGDAAWTYMVGEMTEDGRKLIDAGKAAMEIGIPKIKAGATVNEWAEAVQSVEKTHGVFMVEALGGHGVSKKLHDAPYIPNRVSLPPASLVRFEPNTMVAVEPMLAIGTHKILSKREAWPILTADGSNSAHFEHDLFIGESETIVLTSGLNNLPEVLA
jgi:methionyl aminopeptidase